MRPSAEQIASMRKKVRYSRKRNETPVAMRQDIYVASCPMAICQLAVHSLVRYFWIHALKYVLKLAQSTTAQTNAIKKELQRKSVCNVCDVIMIRVVSALDRSSLPT
eukprot:4818664-Pyramimonas_sp.AAC.1